MPKNFLVGNFLKAYTSSYRYARRVQRVRGLNPDTLSRRFADRAQSYRSRHRRYGLRLQAGVVLALVLMIGATRVDLRPAAAFQIADAAPEVLAMEDVVQTVQRVLPPPPPRPPVPVVVADDAVIDDYDLDLDATLDLDEPLAALPPPPPPPEDEQVAEDDEPDIFVVVEEPPTIVGGWASLAKDLEYPEIAQRAGIEGVVVVEVVIDEEGRPSNAQVIKSVSEVLDDAAIEAILKQRFTPGEQRGRAVRVRMAIPVTFRLRA